jgi:hypothetical protein
MKWRYLYRCHIHHKERKKKERKGKQRRKQIHFCEMNRTVFFSFGIVTQNPERLGRVSFAWKRPELKALPIYGKVMERERRSDITPVWMHYDVK